MEDEQGGRMRARAFEKEREREKERTHFRDTAQNIDEITLRRL